MKLPSNFRYFLFKEIYVKLLSAKCGSFSVSLDTSRTTVSGIVIHLSHLLYTNKQHLFIQGGPRRFLPLRRWPRRIRTVHWRHNEYFGVPNHQPNDCLLNRLFRRRLKKHQSSASLAFVRGIHRSPVISLYKGPVTRKMFPFDDIIMRGSI